jgi:hypothetical protein
MMKHTITHYYQPTNYSCSQTAMAILLSFFDQKLTPEQITKSVPVNKSDKGEDLGTINQQLATWCVNKGFDVEMHTADFEIIDLSWSKFTKDKLLERMEAAKNVRDIPALGKEWSKIYMQSYIDFVNADGNLHIHPFMTTELLDSLLPNSPLLVAVSYNVLHNSGRSKNVGARKSKPDDINGKLTTHSIVVYGKDNGSNYLIADPWKESGLHTVGPEHMLAAMTAAQMECDNLFFQLTAK